jgi:hypothetical protein
VKLTRSRIGAALGLGGDALSGVRLAARLVAYFRRPITRDEALAALRRRHEQRENTFLSIARLSIFEERNSPYRRLLGLAGCEYGDLERTPRGRGRSAGGAVP